MKTYTIRACVGIGLFLFAADVTSICCEADENGSSESSIETSEIDVPAGFLQRYCVDCHGESDPEAGIRVDTIGSVELKPSDGEQLAKILDALSAKEMPPEDAESPNDQDRDRLIVWLENQLDRLADEQRSVGSPAGHRRLTVEEYNFTMQELFGVDSRFDDMLPPDPVSESGYRNEASRLGLSSLQIEAYLDSARRAIGRYVQFGDLTIQPVYYHIELEDLFYSTADRYATRAKAPQPLPDIESFQTHRSSSLAGPPNYVDPLGPKLPGAYTEDEMLRAAIPKLNQQYVAIPRRLPSGEMTIRIRAGGTPDRNGRYPRMRVEAGITLGDGCSIDKRILGEVDVTATLDDPKEFEFRVRLEDVPTKGPMSDEESFDRLSVFDMDQVFISNVSSDPDAIFDLGRGGYSDPETGSKEIAEPLRKMADRGCNFLFLDFLEIEMVPGRGATNAPYRWQVPAVDQESRVESESDLVSVFLGQFMLRAYRRPVSSLEIESKVNLFGGLRAQQYSFEESLRETLVAVLVSPSFLFLQPTEARDETQAKESTEITSYQLASRLSYLLWLAPPDDELRGHADDGTIVRAEVLRSEAQRLLADSRSQRFLESFCRQWLRLDKLRNVAVSRDRYPQYDDDLARLSVRETLDYFVEVFTSDASALDLVESDFAIANDRLAEHYGYDPITSGELQRVTIPEDSIGGGLLTQASLMTMNSDGSDSHPIRRAVWLLDRMMHQPPPPPPPNVPAIDEADPDFRGLSLKEKIELHRRPSACQSCHQKIDPWGIPFESLDATGRFRQTILSGDGGEGREEQVDTATILPDGRSIQDIVELKSYLRQERSHQIAAAMVHHLLTYALGRPPGFADRRSIEVITERFAASDYQLRELVLAIIDSPLFYEPPKRDDAGN